MYKILKKRDLNESNVLMEIEAPRVVKKLSPVNLLFSGLMKTASVFL